jgi:riboflavin synthase
MFTGLIADLGRVLAVRHEDDGATLTIQTALARQLGEGDSIAVNGVCLTATQIDGEEFQAQAMQETLRRSSLGALQAGAPVNLELALRADGRLGGHIVQGHVDGAGTVVEVLQEGFSRVLWIELDVDPGDAEEGTLARSGEGTLARYLAPKGSVAVNGVSLTISALRPGGFSVSLIPETLQRTNLGAAQVGDHVNLEADILAKHVERLMEART